MDKVAVSYKFMFQKCNFTKTICFKSRIILKDTRPETVRKFRGTTQPEAGKERVFYGRANDPDVASRITHGVNTKSSLVVCIISYTI